MRAGWGERHPELAAVLPAVTPLASEDSAFADGTVLFRASAYLGSTDLPDDIVTSIRCIVRVGDAVVVCSNLHGFTHVWPGGRRESGESHVETACREVHEETGWHLDPDSLERLGWVHFERLTGPPEELEYPYPDLLHIVYTGRAHTRAADDWIDTEGYELSSRLVPMAHAPSELNDHLSRHFLEAWLRG